MRQKNTATVTSAGVQARLASKIQVFPPGESRTANLPVLLTLPEACDVLRVSRPTIYRFIKERSLPIVKVGREYRIRRESLLAWLEQSETHYAPKSAPKKAGVE